MANYRAPLDDIRFVVNDLLNYTGHYAELSGPEQVDAESLDMLLR